MMGECLVGQWIVGVISFQKIFGLYGLERHIVEKRCGVTLVDQQRKCEDRARILKQNSQKGMIIMVVDLLFVKIVNYIAKLRKVSIQSSI